MAEKKKRRCCYLCKATRYVEKMIKENRCYRCKPSCEMPIGYWSKWTGEARRNSNGEVKIKVKQLKRKGKVKDVVEREYRRNNLSQRKMF